MAYGLWGVPLKHPPLLPAPPPPLILLLFCFVHPLSRLQLAAMDEDGTIHMNPNFLGQIKQEFPNTMSRMLIACDDGTFRSEKVRGLSEKFVDWEKK